MLTDLAALLSRVPRVGHWLAGHLGLAEVHAMFCSHCPTWDPWPDQDD